jgi:membrane protein implicated in regulation of membrane protease activity
MRTADIILLSLSAAFVIIGTHQTFTLGITASYPIFMLSVALLFWYKYRQIQRQTGEEKQSDHNKPQKRK